MLSLVRRLLSTWNRRDFVDIGVLLGAIAYRKFADVEARYQPAESSE